MGFVGGAVGGWIMVVVVIIIVVISIIAISINAIL